MIKPAKRATVYLDSDLHRVLKLKAAETSRSVSDLVNEAVRHELSEDQEDLQAFADRVNEPTVSYEQLLKDLKRDGKI
ncbi:MAG: CopG family transcriptional regulator [Candidatus Omnitrophota bacterium]|nr:CopG family transcriptional regulator [Candidatus Omnitrophota bacterium]MDZ4243211.1 CopG family transcriptional regulator [Candidatus Omnitrophota bacterium]